MLRTSWTVIRSIRRISRAKLTVFNTLKMRGGMEQRVTPSIPTKSKRPPSSAGRGKRLIMVRLIERSAVKVRR